MINAVLDALARRDAAGRNSPSTGRLACSATGWPTLFALRPMRFGVEDCAFYRSRAASEAILARGDRR